MAELGAVKVKIEADSSGLESGMKRASSSLRRGASELRQSANQFAKWGAAAAGAAAVAGAAIYKATSRSIDQLAKTSDRLGIATERLSELRFAAEQTGVAANTLDMGLQRMTRRISEAAQGSGEAKDALKELGLSAQALARMSPDEQFRQIAEAMQGVSNQGDRVRLAMRLFDSEGVALVNTLKGGTEALDAFSEEAQQLGISISRVDAAKVEAANDAMNRVKMAASGAAQSFTVELAHAVEAVSNQIADAAKEAGGMNEVIRSGLDKVVAAVGVVADAYRGWELIIAALRSAAASMVEFMLRAVQFQIKAIQDLVNIGVGGINKLIEAINNTGLTEIQLISPVQFETLNAVNGMLSVAEGTANRFSNELHNLANQPMPSDNIKQFVADARAASEEAAKVVADSVPGAGGVEGETPAVPKTADDIRKQTEERLKAFQERYASEAELSLQQYQADAEMLVQAKNQELITQEQFNDAVEQSYADHEQRLSDIKKREEQARLNMAKSTFDNLAMLMNTNSKKMFKIGKAAAIASSIIDTYQAITKTMAATPYPWNIPLAAAQAAAGFAQVQNIKKQQFGQAGNPSTFVGGQPAIRTTPAGAGGAQSPGGQAGGSNVNINLVGQSFGRDQVLGLIGAINEAVGDGVTLNTGG